MPGLLFTTLSGGEVCYADINSGWYSVNSDNGKVYEDGEYFISGDVAAYVRNLSEKAKIEFALGPASYFSVGYSSQHPLVLEGYNSGDQLLASVSGPANTKSQGGTGLSYLVVSHADMAYVVIHDEGGYWLMDNITTDAPVPEPGSLVGIGVGLAGLALRRREHGKRRNSR